MNTDDMQRIVVIGSTSSGKTTLAAQLAKIIGAEHIDLDALHWEPNWLEAPDEIFRERVELATRANAWVVAGNYHQVRDIVWPRAQVIVWLDYEVHVVFWRLLTRTIRRTLFKEVIFSGNVEKISTHLKIWSEESLFYWFFKTYWRRKREYPELFALPQHAHLRVLRFEHQPDTDRWLRELTAAETNRSIVPDPAESRSRERPPTRT